jgi:hypothetical protein
LFAAELSDNQLARLRRNDVSATLSALEVPALAWAGAPGETLLRPTRWLEPGAVLSLVAQGFGRLATFDVVSAEAVLSRRWPPSGAPGAGLAVLCGASVPHSAWAFSLEPAALPAELEPNYGTYAGEICAAIRFEPSPATPVLLPPEIDGHLLDPEPLVAGESEAAPLEPACAASEVRIGWLCGVPEDDRLSLAGADRPLLLRAFGAGGAELIVVPAYGRVALRGFAADSPQVLRGELVTPGGLESAFEVAFRTTPARERWVLNEVLSNPLGPEPAQEWVELVNAGSNRASLAGLGLADGGARIELPAVEAEPGEYVVLARDDFTPGGVDLAPAPGAKLVRLPELAKNGLTNAGEPLRLTAAEGSVLSAFPPLASRRAGVSLARRSPERSDDDPDAFGEHAAPGASPGAPNELEP